MCQRPCLFGLSHSNRDFTNADAWGKNQFNSSFPAALACYLHHRNLEAIYLKVDENLMPVFSTISIEDLFGLDPMGDNIFFAFESSFSPYQRYVQGTLPRNDLVIQNLSTGNCISSFEVKLTALPDNSTCELSDCEYGSEIVIRPDTIVYLAASIATKYVNRREELLQDLGRFAMHIDDWSVADNIIPLLCEIRQGLRNVVGRVCAEQSPLIIEPIWKTVGKSPRLADNCLDVFVWSNLAVFNLFMRSDLDGVRRIDRHIRTMIWLFKMLYEYGRFETFDHDRIIDELSYNTKNDKAFSTSGRITNEIMRCPELENPRIMKGEIRNIILGGGQNLLSPERRFDAIIANSPELFV